MPRDKKDGKRNRSAKKSKHSNDRSDDDSNQPEHESTTNTEPRSDNEQSGDNESQSSTEPDKRRQRANSTDEKTDVEIGVQSLNNRSTLSLAYPPNKVTATVRNYQPFCEIAMKEIMTITDIALHPDQWQQTLFGHLQIFFGDDQAVQLELWNAFSWRVAKLISDYNNPENAPFVQAARFLLLGVSSQASLAIDSAKPSLLANAPTIMKREAHLPKSQKALRTMVDRINAQAQEKGTKHNRFSALPEGLLSGTNVRPFTHRRQRQLQAVQRLHRAPTPVPHREGRHYRPRGFP
jgi:hypothetical protein